MYLARKTINGATHYFIRESYRDRQVLRSRDLVHLGTHPARLIHYPGGNAYIIDPMVENVLESCGRTPTSNDLDTLFWDFLRPDIRRALEAFRGRELRARAARRSMPETVDTFHSFDKRRLYYLKTGRIDQRALDRVPLKLFGPLADKSRDEIEQVFIGMESILGALEVKNYVYAIFDLQAFFSESFARTLPQFLDPEAVDARFVEQLCCLNADTAYWAGLQRGSGLQDYLVRYAVMFFDYDYQPRDFMGEYVRQFVNDRRDYHPPPPKPAVSLQEAGSILAVDPDRLKTMSRQDLARLYRRRAMKLHPDQGGDHDTFVKLTETYHSLMRRLS